MRRGPAFWWVLAGAMSLGVAALAQSTEAETAPPEVTSRVEPVYPEGASGEATVALRIDVAADGSVTDVAVTASGGGPFDEAAVAAARQWRFVPARRGGEAVAAQIEVPVRLVPPGPAPPTGTDAEEAEIAAELARIQARQRPEPQTVAEAPPPVAQGASSPHGLSNYFNPAISVNAIALGGGSTRDGTRHEVHETDLRSGLFIQEVELRASAIVDPYFRADVSLNGNAEEVGFEEAVLSTLEIPRLTIRAGQMRASFGRHVLLHTHGFPFITAPLPIARLFGPEGLKEPGVSADLLLPLPFYAEINAQAFQGDWPPFVGGLPEDPDEPPEDRRRDRDLAYVGHLKTLFDLGDSATVELGGTYLGGRNGFGRWTSVVGGDLTVKWRPIEAERYRSLDWSTEWIWQNRPGAPFDRQIGGGHSSLRAQFAQRWWVQARGAVLGLWPRGDEGRTWRGESLVAFVPSELSAIRLQYALEKGQAAEWVHEVFLQAIVSMGAHPAHGY